jgi:hypothetical protein
MLLVVQHLKALTGSLSAVLGQFYQNLFNMVTLSGAEKAILSLKEKLSISRSKLFTVNGLGAFWTED